MTCSAFPRVGPVGVSRCVCMRVGESVQTLTIKYFTDIYAGPLPSIVPKRSIDRSRAKVVLQQAKEIEAIRASQVFEMPSAAYDGAGMSGGGSASLLTC